MNHSFRVSDLVSDGEFLYAISNQDYMHYQTTPGFFVAVSKFDPSQFATAEDLKRNILFGKIKPRGKRPTLIDYIGEGVDLCTISLKPKTDTER